MPSEMRIRDRQIVGNLTHLESKSQTQKQRLERQLPGAGEREKWRDVGQTVHTLR